MPGDPGPHKQVCPTFLIKPPELPLCATPLDGGIPGPLPALGLSLVHLWWAQGMGGRAGTGSCQGPCPSQPWPDRSPFLSIRRRAGILQEHL